MSTPTAGFHPRWARLQYVGLLVVLAVLIVAGYFGFRAFATTSDLSVLNLYALAVVAGVASFFSPCAFPLLPGYLSFYYLARPEPDAAQSGRGRALKLGLAAALGVVTFDLILGVIIATLGVGIAQGLSVSGPQPSLFVRVFRGGVGLVFVLLGIGQIAGWNLKPAFLDAMAYRTRPRREGRSSPAASLYLYGLGYNTAGMGCTGPILAGLMLGALSSGGFASTLSAFVVFSLTMGTAMLVVSGLVAASHQTLIGQLKAVAPKIKLVSSIVLILVGSFNLYSALNVEQFVRLLFP
ncbi:MAG TPA: cytochrome c biogenesis protein CcdA [Anaerolineae bacterium]|nr:cytochrome c biogenesis protein CcdA [Anaerolineae bacterium]